MPKFIVWLSFPLEIEADNEDDASEIAIDQMREADVSSDINIPSIEEIDE